VLAGNFLRLTSEVREEPLSYRGSFLPAPGQGKMEDPWIRPGVIV
jgi:hypothetical protein